MKTKIINPETVVERIRLCTRSTLQKVDAAAKLARENRIDWLSGDMQINESLSTMEVGCAFLNSLLHEFPDLRLEANVEIGRARNAIEATQRELRANRRLNAPTAKVPA